MSSTNEDLQQSALVMKIMGWGTIVACAICLFVYPPGFMWGSPPAGFPHIGPAHPESPYEGLRPYVSMIGALYLAWAILMTRGCRDPKTNASVFDWGIFANPLHGPLMLGQSFYDPNEHAPLWADVPALFALSAACWFWHPHRIAPEAATS